MKQAALRMIHGEEGKQWAKLWDYKVELERTNLGSTVKIDYDGLTFQRMYICLNALKRGFLEGCRRFIGVDGCFLKHVRGWQLLSAVGVDGNGGIYPIAWAVVEAETTASWDWFIESLAADLRITNSPEWTWMSDRQKGLTNVLERRFPFAEHRYCVRHLWHNMAAKFKHSMALKNMMWDAARATYLQGYQAAMDTLRTRGLKYKKDDVTPADWLMERDVQTWSKCFYQTRTRCDMSLNNHCEVFNRWILEARDMPILSCLETIRCKIMRRLHTQRIRLARLPHDAICPVQSRKISVNKGKAAFWYPMYNGDGEFEVQGDRNFVVKLRKFECACGSWQLSGIPCEHAIACINHNGEKLVDYVHDSFLVGTYNRSYSVSIHPLNDSAQWLPGGGPVLRAPTFKPLVPGPVQKKRRLSVGELETTRRDKRGRTFQSIRKTGQKQRCTVCKKEGHNKRVHSQVEPNRSQAGTSSQQHESPTRAPRSGVVECSSPRVGVHEAGATFVATPSVRMTRSKVAALASGSSQKQTRK
ncbi:hypothetical protein LINPERHAP1_LOCUS16739 [Linum perenne]